MSDKELDLELRSKKWKKIAELIKGGIGFLITSIVGLAMIYNWFHISLAQYKEVGFYTFALSNWSWLIVGTALQFVFYDTLSSFSKNTITLIGNLFKKKIIESTDNKESL